MLLKELCCVVPSFSGSRARRIHLVEPVKPRPGNLKLDSTPHLKGWQDLVKFIWIEILNFQTCECVRFLFSRNLGDR